MRIVSVAASVLAGLLLSVSAARADFYTTGGHKVKLFFTASVNPDCSSAGDSTIRVTKSPEHGRVNVTRVREFGFFRESNPRSACNRRRVAGVAIYYTAQRGYTGYDTVGFEVYYPSGSRRSATANIQVR